MSKRDRIRAALNLLGFIFGLASGCFAISDATISILIVNNALRSSGGAGLDISSQIVISLCVVVAALGVLLVRGSYLVWKARILGSAINLTSGIVLTGLSVALFTIGGGVLGKFAFASSVEPILMSSLSVMSGSFSLIALFD